MFYLGLLIAWPSHLDTRMPFINGNDCYLAYDKNMNTFMVVYFKECAPVILDFLLFNVDLILSCRKYVSHLDSVSYRKFLLHWFYFSPFLWRSHSENAKVNLWTWAVAYWTLPVFFPIQQHHYYALIYIPCYTFCFSTPC